MFLFSKSRTDKSPWSYPAKHPQKNGAFRAVAVDPLLVGAPYTPQIHLYEWSTITFRNKSKGTLMRGISYAAISHVWNNGYEVEQEFQKVPATERLRVTIRDDPGYKEISWDGLIQAARAAKFKKAKYIWVDFLCLDQQDSGQEKALQIALMASIYRYASRVIIMIAGIVSVGAVNHQTAWIDRAWTLQEAVINEKGGKETYVYVQWPQSYPKSFKDERGATITFYQVKGDDCLITFRDMFKLADTDLTKILKFPPKVTVLNSPVKGSGDVPRSVLQAAAFANKKGGRDTARWRSMFLRQSTYPVDIVYSLMGCLGLDIDPYRNYRSPEYLFNDLARKASVSPVGPAWLIVSGVTGSKIRRQDQSRLIPQFPSTASDKPSAFIAKNTRMDIANYIDTSANYIEKYDIKFVTQSHPHIISAIMLPVKSFTRLKPPKAVGGNIIQGRASMSIGKVNGTCFYRGVLNKHNYKKNVFAVYVGDVKDMGIPGKSADQAGNKYFLFLQWKVAKGGWYVIADGTFRKKAASKWNLGRERWLFTVGEGSQKNEMRWLQDQPKSKLMKWLSTGRSIYPRDIRTRPFEYHNYGFMPLNNINTQDADDKNQRIKWIGYQYKGPPKSKNFQKYSFKIDTREIDGVEDLAAAFGKPDPIRFVGCNTRGDKPPKDTDTAKKKNINIRTFGSIKMEYVYDSWKVSVQGEAGRESSPGIRVPDKTGVITVNYWMRVQFGARMVFFILKSGLKTPSQFHQVHIRCYGQHSGRRLNRNMESGRPKFAK